MRPRLLQHREDFRRGCEACARLARHASTRSTRPGRGHRRMRTTSPAAAEAAETVAARRGHTAIGGATANRCRSRARLHRAWAMWTAGNRSEATTAFKRLVQEVRGLGTESGKVEVRKGACCDAFSTGVDSSRAAIVLRTSLGLTVDDTGPFTVAVKSTPVRTDPPSRRQRGFVATFRLSASPSAATGRSRSAGCSVAIAIGKRLRSVTRTMPSGNTSGSMP